MNADEAKTLMQGPLGQEMAKYPLRFCKAAFFGEPPSRANPIAVNNGTASLIDVGDRPFAITCLHVVEGYKKKLENSPRCFFQIGNCRFDPVAQLVSEDAQLDLATVELTPGQAKEITLNSNGIGEIFYKQKPWPPKRVVEGDFVAFGGFPGDLRKLVSVAELNFGTYSSGAVRVSSSRDDYFVCQFEREHWVKHFNEPEPATIGGLSGGPAFVIRHSENGIISYEFAGVIFQFSEDYELLYMRHADDLVLGCEG